MGVLFSVGKPRDATFHPDDIIITDDVVERIKAANARDEVVDLDEPHKAESLKSVFSVLLDRDLLKVEERYQRCLQQLEHRNEQLYNKALEEYTKTVERLESKYMRPLLGGCCAAAEQRVSDCYKHNPGKILLCAKLISEYDRCVQNYRMTLAKKTAVSSPS